MTDLRNTKRLIHPTAQIDPKAELEEGVEIGPFVVIGAGARIGRGTSIGPYTLIEGKTVIGQNNVIGPHVTLGTAPQHLAYRGEPTRLEIGDENVIREYVSIHRGTLLDQGVTKVGNRCYLMAYTHVGHDCVLADEVILTNGCQLGGHVKIDFGAVLGGGVFVHQFCRIGELAFVAGMSGVDKDVPPFLRVFGKPAQILGINLVGLKRRGFGARELKIIDQVLKLYLSGGTVKEVCQRIKELFGQEPLANKFLEFIANPSSRGLTRKKLG